MMSAAPQPVRKVQLMTTARVQEMLEENFEYIKMISDFQSSGRLVEANQYSTRLHANLQILAEIADATTPNDAAPAAMATQSAVQPVPAGAAQHTTRAAEMHSATSHASAYSQQHVRPTGPHGPQAQVAGSHAFATRPVLPTGLQQQGQSAASAASAGTNVSAPVSVQQTAALPAALHAQQTQLTPANSALPASVGAGGGAPQLRPGHSAGNAEPPRP